jgi:hypothetical protein
LKSLTDDSDDDNAGRDDDEYDADESEGDEEDDSDGDEDGGNDGDEDGGNDGDEDGGNDGDEDGQRLVVGTDDTDVDSSVDVPADSVIAALVELSTGKSSSISGKGSSNSIQLSIPIDEGEEGERHYICEVCNNTREDSNHHHHHHHHTHQTHQYHHHQHHHQHYHHHHYHHQYNHHHLHQHPKYKHQQYIIINPSIYLFIYSSASLPNNQERIHPLEREYIQQSLHSVNLSICHPTFLFILILMMIGNQDSAGYQDSIHY